MTDNILELIRLSKLMKSVGRTIQLTVGRDMRKAQWTVRGILEEVQVYPGGYCTLI